MISEEAVQLVILREGVNVSFYLPQILTASTNVVCKALQKACAYSSGIDSEGNFTICLEEEREFLNRRYDENLELWFKNKQPKSYSKVDNEDFNEMLEKVKKLGIDYFPIYEYQTDEIIGFVTEPISSSIDSLI